MNPDRNLVRYACVAHSPSTTTTTTTSDESSTTTTILAEYNPSGDLSIHELAQKCLIRTPAYHSMFNHNIRGTSYTLLISDPFIFFAVSDEVLPKSDRIRLLSQMKDALHDLMMMKKKNHSKNKKTKKKDSDDVGFSEYCYQGELGPLFNQLMGIPSPKDDDDHHHHPELGLVNGGGGGDDVVSRNDDDSVQSRGVGCGRRGFGFPKKKRKLFEERPTGEIREVVVVDGNDDKILNSAATVVAEEGKSRGGSNNGGVLCSSDGKQKAKKMWRKHVWIVLFMDLAVCLILFGIWLMICHGFQCLDG